QPPALLDVRFEVFKGVNAQRQLLGRVPDASRLRPAAACGEQRRTADQQHQRQVGSLHFTEKSRSMRLVLPWRSFTSTIRRVTGRSTIGFESVSSQTPGATSLKRCARLLPGAEPSMATSAVTRKLAGSMPLR